ncbi:AAC(3) family N-acetyltransferase [Campylobacter pinnipediorum]|uniref:AAC(3) family N-acetyltransferase n=1 Tax=Campylobacter pinnipediorum TaxID=1965231 RepID=UPI0018E93229|nr:AAC(3) family N-acetyltransferase [Campylobacter pinnipediorum]
MEDFIDKFEIKIGDFILITGNLIKFIKKAKKIDKEFNLNLLIDSILDKIGNSGTLAIQTFNWQFCSGETYDILNTKSETGSLGNIALKRNDFKRTRHPIYSFAVAGKYQNELISLRNKGAFDANSPFDFMYKHNAKMIIIGLPLQNSFTFVHYVEEMHKVSYRYNKTFTSYYIDDKGNKELVEYDMYVRDIKNKVLTFIEPLESIFIENNVMKVSLFDGIEIKKIDLYLAYNIIKKDILENNGNNLYKIG